MTTSSLNGGRRSVSSDVQSNVCEEMWTVDESMLFVIRDDVVDVVVDVVVVVVVVVVVAGVVVVVVVVVV